MTAFTLADRFPPLTDKQGEPYPARDLVCVRTPPMRDVERQPFLMWDDDAPLALRRQAAVLCRACPALLACWDRRRQLIRSGTKVGGVWAARVTREYTRGDRFVGEHDPVVVAWAAAAGVTLPTIKGEP